MMFIRITGFVCSDILFLTLISCVSNKIPCKAKVVHSSVRWSGKEGKEAAEEGGERHKVEGQDLTSTRSRRALDIIFT